MLNDLRKCTFQIGSFDKRFVRDVSGAVNSGQEITERQAALIPTMHYRYRRQHGKKTPNYDPTVDPKAHRNKRKMLEDADKLKRWNESSNTDTPHGAGR